MKQCVKKSLCILLCAMVVFSTVALGFMSTAQSSHYFDNINFKKVSSHQLEQMWNEDESFIFVLYASYLDECRNIGTDILEKYWMNEYNTTIYGVNVFDHSQFGSFGYDNPPSPTAMNYEARLEEYELFHLPEFLRDFIDPRTGLRWFDFFTEISRDQTHENEPLPETDLEVLNIFPYPIIGFVKNGEIMTFDRTEDEVPDNYRSSYTAAIFPQLDAVLNPLTNDPEDYGTLVPNSSYNRGYYTASDFRAAYSQDTQLSGYQQHLLDLNKAFFTYLGENPIIEVDAIPPGADIDPGESLQTLRRTVRPLHEVNASKGHHNSSVLLALRDFDFYNFDGSGLDTNDNDPYPDNEFEKYEDDYYDFSDNNINYNVVWISSDPSKVAVDQNGKITAVSPHPATVIIRCEAADKRLAPWLPKWDVSPHSTTWYDQFPITIVPHNWVNPVGVILPGDEATCTSPGKRTYTCTDEGCKFRTHPYVEIIPSDDAHKPAASYTPVAGFEANCRTETNGKAELLCTICNQVLDTRNISWRDSHVWQTVTVSPLTCTTDGHTVQECSVCGVTKEDSDEYEYAKGHTATYAYVTGFEPTCTEPGREQQVCTICDEVIPGTERAAAALGHDWGESFTDENGDKLHTCNRCDITEKAKLSLWERIIAFFKSLFESFGAIFA